MRKRSDFQSALLVFRCFVEGVPPRSKFFGPWLESEDLGTEIL